MAYMHSLTVSGQTYTVKDPEAVSFTQSQQLTPRQQAQACSNMGVWSGKDIADKLCPAFIENGSMVTCEPVEDYPLEVVAQPEATQITRCGKNLFGGDAMADAMVSFGATKNEENGTVSFYPNGLSNPSGWLFDMFKENTQYTVILRGTCGHADKYANLRIRYTDNSNENFRFLDSNLENGYYRWTTNPNKQVSAFAFYNQTGGIVTTTIEYASCGIFEGDVSCEDFETYRGGVFAPAEEIPALSGVNVLYADAGEITVAGRSDPAAMIEKLTNAVAALGGNV